MKRRDAIVLAIDLPFFSLERGSNGYILKVFVNEYLVKFGNMSPFIVSSNVIALPENNPVYSNFT